MNGKYGVSIILKCASGDFGKKTIQTVQENTGIKKFNNM